MLSKMYLVVAASFFQFCTSSVVKSDNNNNNKQSNTPTDTLAVFTWTDAACEYTGNYNPRTYSPVCKDRFTYIRLGQLCQ
jgi:hypothetical protein